MRLVRFGPVQGLLRRTTLHRVFLKIGEHVLLALKDLVQIAAVRVFNLVDLAGALLDRFSGP